MELIDVLKDFYENEARSCSMDFGCVKPESMFRSWGGTVSIEDIRAGLIMIELPTR